MKGGRLDGEGETKSKNLKIVGGKWLVLIDSDVAVHVCTHYSVYWGDGELPPWV